MLGYVSTVLTGICFTTWKSFSHLSSRVSEKQDLSLEYRILLFISDLKYEVGHDHVTKSTLTRPAFQMLTLSQSVILIR